jgi:hypothetical protein
MNSKRPNDRKDGFGSLTMQVKTMHNWPTPTAHNAKETNAPSEANRNTPTLANQVGGKLNPTWTEWLMGWPLNWTSLGELKNDNFERWAQGCATSHSGNSVHPLWWTRDPSEASQRQESTEQRCDEFGSALPALPQNGAHEGRDVGAGNSGEGDMQGVRPRLSTVTESESVDLQPSMPVGVGSSERPFALEYAPRVATGTVARTDRLKAIGNGQVPLCAATVWRLLNA